MSVYIIGFITSTTLLYISKKVLKKQQWIIVLIALLIPCCIAGFRADSVGTDVRRYLVQMTNAAILSDGIKDYLSTEWFMLWQNLHVSDYEIGFSLLVYIVARLLKSIYAVQFFIQALTVIPIYFALKTVNKGEFAKFCWLGMLTYYFIFFNTSLNVMRQCVAMSFVFLAFAYLTNDSRKKCILFTVIGILFHTSALLGIVIFIIYIYVERERKRNFKLGWIKISGYYINMFIIISGGIIAILIIDILSTMFGILGLARYLGYISGTITFMPNQLISRLPIFILFIYIWKKYKTDNSNMKFLFTMLCFDLLCSQFTSVNSFGGRIALYFSQYQMLTYPAILLKEKQNKVILFLIIAYMFFYWWFYFVYSGSNATIPYIMGI